MAFLLMGEDMKPGYSILTVLIAALSIALFAGCGGGSGGSGGGGSGSTGVGTNPGVGINYDQEAVDLALGRAGSNAPELQTALDSVPDGHKGAMAFLICNMKDKDLTTVPSDLLIEHVEYAYRAKEEMPWGGNVSERDFCHYVLPYRAHPPEPAQKWRKLFYDEIAPRVQGMTIEQAAVEANNWAASKAQYDKDRPPNPRDPGVLVTIKNGYGFCGELTQLYVAAARSICIPTRATGVKKWGDRDGNHVWGEVLASGRWRFVESCIENCELDKAWWTKHAAVTSPIRAQVFGKREVVEMFANVLSVWEDFCYIDVTANYR
ncbi:MAG: transglutaminase domain-containing protein [Planctomycetota bacterium]|nr:MAG: transglutaminase domain-containing protein [Planctomycetota bacterium]